MQKFPTEEFFFSVFLYLINPICKSGEAYTVHVYRYYMYKNNMYFVYIIRRNLWYVRTSSSELAYLRR